MAKIQTYGGTAALPTQYSYDPATGKSTKTGVVYSAPTATKQVVPPPVSTPISTSVSTPIVTPTTTNAIDISKIATTPSKPIIPPTQDLTASQAPVISTAQENINKLQADQLKADELEVSKAKSSYDVIEQAKTLLAEQISGKGAEQLAMETSAGIPAQRETIKNLNQQINSAVNAYNQKQLMASRSGIPQPTLAGQLRDEAMIIGNLTASSQILQGNITAAEDTISKTIDAKYSGLTTLYNDKIDTLTRNESLLTSAQKTLAEEKKAQYESKLQEIETEKKSMNDLIFNATQAGAPASLTTKALATGDSMKAAEILGVYGGGLAAIEKRAQINKINAEISAAKETGADTSTISSPTVAGGMGGSILAQTNISLPVFNYLTQGTSSMSRMSAAQRNTIMKEATEFLNSRGIDVSTFQSRYKTYNDVLSKNIEIFGNVQRVEGELTGTIANTITAAEEAGLSDARALNAAKLWVKGEFSNPDVAKYGFHLNQLRSELAAYNAATQGRTSSEVRDSEEANNLIKMGIASGSLIGLEEALARSVQKMGVTLQSSVDRANKNIWGLFGIADKYKPSSVPEVSSTGSGNIYSIENTPKIINNQGTTTGGVKFTIIP